MHSGNCYVVLLTPPGRGAVATVLVIGERATAIVERHFRAASTKQLSEVPLGRIVFGRWQGTEYSVRNIPYSSAPVGLANSAGEEVVVCRSQNDAVEIHCHGGQAASQAIIDSLTAAGCEQMAWRDWIVATATDRIRAAAQIMLTEAATSRTAAVLNEQMNGRLAFELQDIIKLLETGVHAAGLKRLATLHSHARVGRHLVTPFRVVLAGRPNVGKSSLMNAILGYTRAIVFDEPGTTRDVVTATTAIDGWPVELSDTAGLRVSRDEIEFEGVARARRAAATADLLVLVFDTAPPWSSEDQALIDAYPESILVINKCDRHCGANVPPNALATSALTGDGIAALIRAIGERLVPAPPQPGDAVPFTTQQCDTIAHALQLANSGEYSRAADALRELVR